MVFSENGWRGVAEWREERESSRLRKRVEEIKIAGRPPVAQQRVSAKELPAAEDLDELTKTQIRQRFSPRAHGNQFHELERVVPPKKSGSEPKISRGKTIYKLPSQLAAANGRARPEDGRKRAEGMRARHRTEMRRIRRGRSHHPNQSRPRGHHLRIEARGRNQVQPHHGARRRPLPGAESRIDFDRTHPGKVHRWNRSA